MLQGKFVFETIYNLLLLVLLSYLLVVLGNEVVVGGDCVVKFLLRLLQLFQTGFILVFVLALFLLQSGYVVWRVVSLFL